LQKVLAKC